MTRGQGLTMAQVTIRSCVIPAAGLGTRFLPATKVLPKELLPVLDRPLIEWGVEEAVSAGATTAVIVLSRGKEILAAHFDRAPRLEETLRRRGRQSELDAIMRPSTVMQFAYVYQGEPLGLGHAVLQARSVVGDETFACLLPDDLSYAKPPVLAQLAQAHETTGTTILALMRVTPDQISRYGCATVAESRGRLHRIVDVVEKPKAEEAPSDLAIMGRYILTPDIFRAIESTDAGVGGEIQLTDAIGRVVASSEVWGLEFEGELLDVGTPTGWMSTMLRLAPTHPLFAPIVEKASLTS